MGWFNYVGKIIELKEKTIAACWFLKNKELDLYPALC